MIHLSRHLFALILLVNNLVHTARGIDSVESIHFVITKSKFMECCFALPPTATLVDLQKEVSSQCDVQYPFEIQLFGKPIVSVGLLNTEMIAQNPCIKSAWNMLSDFWNITIGLRIPLKIRAPSDQGSAVYVSLLQMFGGLEANAHELDWFQFIHECAQSTLCSIQDLCDLFKGFSCRDGELNWIGLNGLRLEGTIDLFFLPSTVTKLEVKRNLLTEIRGLDRLGGKQLKSLRVEKNPLEINVQQLVRSDSSPEIPLRCIYVSACQIARSLKVVPENALWFGQRVKQAVDQWLTKSCLDQVCIGSNKSWRRTRCIHRHGELGMVN